MSVIAISLSKLEKELITDCWEIIMKDADKFSSTFYQKLFSLDNSVRPLFKENLRLQQIKFVDSIIYLIKSMNDLEEATNRMRILGLKHKGYAVKPKHYPTFASALMHSFQVHLGDTFTEGCKIAWSKLYDILSELMI